MMDHDDKSCCRAGLWIFGAALAIRLIGLWVLFPSGGWKDVGYGSELGPIAGNLAEGRGFSSPFENGAQPSAWLSPLVPLVWAGVFASAGGMSVAALVVIGIMQCVVSAAACVVYYLIALHLWRMAGGVGCLWPLMASTVLSVWPMCLKAATVFWYFSWQELAMAVLFLAALKWVSAQSLRTAVVMGACAAIMALINPVPLVILPGALFVACPAATSMPSTRTLTPQNQRAAQPGLLGVSFQFVVACAVAGLIIAPWLIRNAVRLHAFVPIRSSFGVELLQGNNPEGAIMQRRQSLHPALNPVERARFNAVGEIGYNRWAMRSALDYVRAHPGMTARRIALRVYAFWCSDVRGDWAWEARRPWWHEGPVATVKALAKIGLWLFPLTMLVAVAAGGGWAPLPARALFVMLFVCFPLPYYLTHVSPMYAYAMQPYLLMAALVGLGLKREAEGGRRVIHPSP
jgi:hypothetical protein